MVRSLLFGALEDESKLMFAEAREKLLDLSFDENRDITAS